MHTSVRGVVVDVCVWAQNASRKEIHTGADKSYVQTKAERQQRRAGYVMLEGSWLIGHKWEYKFPDIGLYLYF